MVKSKRKPEKVVFGGTYLVPEVLQDRRLSGIEKLIICDVGHYTNQGCEYPYNLAQTATKFGVTWKAIHNAMARLESSGRVVNTGRDNYHRSLHLNSELGKHFKAISKGEIEPAKSKKTYPENSEQFQLAKLLYDEIKNRKSDFRKPDFQAWSKHIDLAIHRDGRDPARIDEVIRWCQSDNGNGQWQGWQNNILSTKTLRAKFDKLEMSMGRKNGDSSQIRQHSEAAYIR